MEEKSRPDSPVKEETQLEDHPHEVDVSDDDDSAAESAEPEDGDKPDDKKKKKFKKKSEEEKLRDKIKALETSLLAKDKEITDQKSKFLFLQAELDNTRKHFLKQAESSKMRTKADVLTAFTPVIDAFEHAFKNKDQILKNQSADGKCSIDQFVKGFENIWAQFNSILDSYHVKTIKEFNVPFDYRIHEVMMKFINDNIPEDTVVSVAQKGYMIDNQVIRPAMVIVSKHTPPPEPPTPVEKEIELQPENQVSVETANGQSDAETDPTTGTKPPLKA